MGLLLFHKTHAPMTHHRNYRRPSSMRPRSPAPPPPATKTSTGTAPPARPPYPRLTLWRSAWPPCLLRRRWAPACRWMPRTLRPRRRRRGCGACVFWSIWGVGPDYFGADVVCAHTHTYTHTHTAICGKQTQQGEAAGGGQVLGAHGKVCWTDVCIMCVVYMRGVHM